MNKKSASLATTMAVLFLVFGLSQSVRANVMNFEGVPTGGLLKSDFIQDGIRLSLISGHYDIFECGMLMMLISCPAANGSVGGLDVIGLQSPPISSIRISLVSGSSFNLDSIEIVYAGSYFVPAPNFMSASDGSGFIFNSAGQFGGLVGIQYFDVSSVVPIVPGLIFDNIVVTPVPEPSTSLAVLGVLLLGMSVIFRRSMRTCLK